MCGVALGSFDFGTGAREGGCAVSVGVPVSGAGPVFTVSPSSDPPL